jgi:hypothetical protein
MTDRRQLLCDWLTANGLDPNVVPIDADITIGKEGGHQALRCEVLTLDANGRSVIDERGECYATHTVVVPLAVEPPEWWQPHVKPTRAQLLGALEAVSKLHVCNVNSGTCTHCSERDYPNYEVPWPCPTMQAVGSLLVPPVPVILRAARWRQTDTGGCLTYDGPLTREEAAALRQAAQDWFDAGGDPRLLGTPPEEKA